MTKIMPVSLGKVVQQSELEPLERYFTGQGFKPAPVIGSGLELSNQSIAGLLMTQSRPECSVGIRSWWSKNYTRQSADPGVVNVMSIFRVNSGNFRLALSSYDSKKGSFRPVGDSVSLNDFLERTDTGTDLVAFFSSANPTRPGSLQLASAPLLANN
ncbi:MAG: hypothetical protein WDO70_05280 [Alphaproteobacteria bacterium]